jgi:hypothetical protein
MIATKATKKYVDGSYAADNPDWHAGDSAWKTGKIMEIVRRNMLQPESVCEVGCGAGEILLCMQRQMSSRGHFTGFEPSPQAFAIAAPKANEKLQFVDSSMPESGAFDLVLLIDVFEHVEDCFGFLRSLARIGRKFIFHIPLDLSAISVAREWPLMKRRRGVGHIHYFTKATALALLEDAGFRVVDYSYTMISRPSERSLRASLTRHLPHAILSRLGFEDLSVRIFGEHSLMVLAEPDID